MSGIFVSHASADEQFVTPFVEQILQLGCNLSPQEIFYSSGADTGIEPGENLNTYLREKARDSDLVIAVISPMYQASAYCVAELGAAWTKYGALFPVLTPGMKYTDLEGILSGLLTGYINDRDTLNKLHDRVTKVTGRAVLATTWGKRATRWLASVDDLAKGLTVPQKIDLTEFWELKDQLKEAQEALRSSENDLRELERQNKRIVVAKTAEEVREAALPENEIERFRALQDVMRKSFRKILPIVEDAIWYKTQNQRLAWPHAGKDEGSHDDAAYSLEQGHLVETFEELDANLEFPDVMEAYSAAEALAAFIKEVTPEFDEWFRSEYNAPANLGYKRAWDAIK
ncbi:toll/interleukin-1 receptor domain-containing protein [Amycolatopsis sp. cmx-11-51]|uniref:toll/interleukin-1 receptor domain-containing protein n=1 Tax=Amycolatopsis sp. cmx-11-51 TaxID=2785797 RepID=UPI0039E690D9